MSYRRPANKGKKCVRRKRVRVRVARGRYVMALRCASYGRRSKHRGRRRGRRPFNKGVKCREWGLNRLGRRTCRSYGGVYGDKKKNRRRSRPSDTFVQDVRAHQNKMQRMMYETEENIPAWWVT